MSGGHLSKDFFDLVKAIGESRSKQEVFYQSLSLFLLSLSFLSSSPLLMIQVESNSDVLR
jgi:hypothetical protein